MRHIESGPNASSLSRTRCRAAWGAFTPRASGGGHSGVGGGRLGEDGWAGTAGRGRLGGRLGVGGWVWQPGSVDVACVFRRWI